MVRFQRQTLGFISSSTFVDITQSIRDTMSVAFCTRQITDGYRSAPNRALLYEQKIGRSRNYRERANYEAAKV